MSKELGFDKDGQQKHMRPVDYLTDSLGQFSLNSLGQLTGQLGLGGVLRMSMPPRRTCP